MYVPNEFREDDVGALQALMRAYSFAVLVTADDGGPCATHLPFLLDGERGPYGTLVGHVARRNPQWRTFASGREALVVFQGPHAYVSPRWYAGARIGKAAYQNLARAAGLQRCGRERGVRV